MGPRSIAALAVAALVAVAGAHVAGQTLTAVPSPLRLLTPSGTRTLPTVLLDDTEMVALDDVAATFQVTVSEDTLAKAITVTSNGRTIVVSPDQALASIGGRLVSLPAPPARVGGRWYVPVEFVHRALGVVYDQKLDLRKASRLLIVGDLRVPRVVVRHDVPGNMARVTFDIVPATPHQVIQESGRLLVRFEADALDVTLPEIRTLGFVDGVRVGDPPTTLVVVLGSRFASFRATDAPLANGTRLTIDALGATAPPPGDPTTDAAPDAAPSPAPVFPPLGGVPTIVIDPGHGGDEPGARGPGGTLEKTVTLAVARRLKGALEARLGARVLLTREDDRTLSLDERAALANNNKADLFLSLHANSSVRPGAAGAEVFYLSLDPSDAETQRAAASVGIALPVFGGGSREIDVLPWDMAQARHIDASAGFARAVAERLGAVVPMSPRALQQAPFRVLVGANMPAVLVEMGYLSNPGQESQLAAGEFQGRIMQALVEAIARVQTRTRPMAAPPEADGGGGR